MASLLIRNLDEDVKQRLREQAARNARSMEAEARVILNDGLKDKALESGNFATLVWEIFGPTGGFELPPRNDGVAGDSVSFEGIDPCT